MTKRYDDLPEALKREIRELAGVVHERLLAAELRKYLVNRHNPLISAIVNSERRSI